MKQQKHNNKKVLFYNTILMITFENALVYICPRFFFFFLCLELLIESRSSHFIHQHGECQWTELKGKCPLFCPFTYSFKEEFITLKLFSNYLLGSDL